MLKTLDKLKDKGVAIIFISLPEMPHCNKFDFFNWRKNFETLIGDVLITDKGLLIELFCSENGTGSSLPGRVAFETNYFFKVNF